MVKVFGSQPSQVVCVGLGPAYENLHQRGLSVSGREAEIG